MARVISKSNECEAKGRFEFTDTIACSRPGAPGSRYSWGRAKEKKADEIKNEGGLIKRRNMKSNALKISVFVFE